jgi:hypothetical protein
MKKVKITFNGKTKVVEATDEFLKADALAEMAATNCIEHFWMYSYEYPNVNPWIPTEEYDEDKAQKAASKLNDDFDRELAKLISKNFNVNITSECFSSQSFTLTKQDEIEGIYVKVEADDLELEDFKTLIIKKHMERKISIDSDFQKDKQKNKKIC